MMRIRRSAWIGRAAGMISRMMGLTLTTLIAATSAAAQVEVTEATIAELQEAMASGRVTSREITAAYLARIAAYDQVGTRLHAMIRVNPNALTEAEALDRERAARGPRGDLHGIPIILKDNFDFVGMATTAGSVTLSGLHPAADGFQVRRLREAGAVIVGKANMHEFAYGITTISSLGGQTLNPYDLKRNPGGSSGGTGTAIAASFAVVGWGSDTCGSIRIPASHNNLVGLRATKGLSSIAGILPLAHTQDVGGPLARTVRDLAIALDATIGPDPADPATNALAGRPLPRFVDSLDERAFAGVRIGILSNFFGDRVDNTVAQAVRDAITRMVQLGADTVTVEVPGYQELVSESSVIGHEFKWDLLDYLATVPGAPVRSLDEVLDHGMVHEALLATIQRANSAEARETAGYQAALAKRALLQSAVLSVMDAARVDALAYPTIGSPPAVIGEAQGGSNCQLSASTGLPAISAPAGWAGDLPIGVELLGRPFDDARLVAFAYALEQAGSQRRAPAATPPLTAGAPPPTRVAVTRATSQNGAAGASARFEYDASKVELGYELEVVGIPAGEVYAVVLRHTDSAGRSSVIARLSGPGATASTGSLWLTPQMRQRLMAGELFLELVAKGEPFSVARGQIVLMES